MFFVIGLIIGCIIWYLSSRSATIVPNGCEKVHQWVLRDMPDSKLGYLICKRCGKLPGGE